MNVKIRENSEIVAIWKLLQYGNFVKDIFLPVTTLYEWKCCLFSP